PHRGRRQDRLRRRRVRPPGRRHAATRHAGLVAGATLRRVRRLGGSRATADPGCDATDRLRFPTTPPRARPRLHNLLGRPRLRLLGMRRPRMRIVEALALAVLLVASAANPGGQTSQAASSPPVAVGPQYDTTHVYVAPEDFDRFVASLVATF